ncbi:MAG: hypothetical protein JO089_05465 [Alphaproteobacteria bacterium]|nr:hypothetical protein [Alphaproteobacteria bacterium]
MIRLLLYVVVFGAISALAAWLADYPGHVTFTWEGWRVDTSIAMLLLALGIELAFLLFVWSCFRALLHLPRRAREWKSLRQSRQTLKAVTESLVALAASDLPAARKATRRVEALQPGQPISLLLGAQVAKAEGNDARMRLLLNAMLTHAATRFLAARSLSDYHLQHADAEAGLHYAHDAQAAQPESESALRLTVESFLRLGQMGRALNAVDAARRHISRSTRRRLQALIYLAQLETATPEAALMAARKATRLVTDIPESAPLLSRFYTRRELPKEAARVLRAAERHGYRPAAHYACGRCGNHDERWRPLCIQCGGLDTLRRI